MMLKALVYASTCTCTGTVIKVVASHTKAFPYLCWCSMHANLALSTLLIKGKHVNVACVRVFIGARPVERPCSGAKAVAVTD